MFLQIYKTCNRHTYMLVKFESSVYSHPLEKIFVSIFSAT